MIWPGEKNQEIKKWERQKGLLSGYFCVNNPKLLGINMKSYIYETTESPSP